MDKDYVNLIKRYKLRHAAGEYFLVDMEQDGLNFIAPKVLNETGADIWTFYSETENINDTVKKVCEIYGIDENTAVDAVTGFLEDIRKF